MSPVFVRDNLNRRLAQDLTHPLITSLQAECTRATCPEMKAGEWLYLCVAHGTGTSGTMEVSNVAHLVQHSPLMLSPIAMLRYRLHRSYA